MIFVVGDAPPHSYGDGWNYKRWARQAIAKGIVVNTVRCGADATTASAFREIAGLADGPFITIDASGGMVALSTPYDAKIARLTEEIAETRLYAGAESARRAAESEGERFDAMDDAAKSDRASYLTKRALAGGEAPGAIAAAPRARGLTDLVTATPEVIAATPTDELPAQLRGLSKAERIAKARALEARRAKLERELIALSRRRDEHIAAHGAERADSFDGAVMKEVRSRAREIGVTYE